MYLVIVYTIKTSYKYLTEDIKIENIISYNKSCIIVILWK